MKPFWGIVIVFITVSLIAAPVKQIKKLDGSTINTGEIDKTMIGLMDAANVTGLALAILNNNKIAYLKTFGFRNREKGALLDENTIMLGASFSKAVFAYLAMQLVQEGILDLDKPLCRYLDKPLPEYDGYQDLAADEQWKLISARMCLSHTTGFPNARWLNPRGNNKLEIFFRPGTRYAYSGEGIQLLQLAIEKITGKEVEKLAREKIFRPLGMKSTSYVWQDMFKNNFAVGHDDIEIPVDYYTGKMTRASAGGSLQTSISDYAKFIAAVMQGKGLKKSSRQMMLAPQIAIRSRHQFPSLAEEVTDQNDSIALSYGLGWGLFKCQYGRAFFKEGHGEGWQNYNVNFPDRKISIIIMTNSDNGEKIFKDVLEKTIGDTFTPWEWEGYIPYYSMKKQSVGRRLYDIIKLKDVQVAIMKYRRIKASSSKAYNFAESELHNLAKQMIKENRIDDAVELFKLNVEEYPDSANVYDSLGEAYMSKGNKELAIKNYKKSLVLDPKNTNAAEMLQKLDE
ncbi:MAG: serine hydrolase [Candidatus Aminicenantes bacterium]|nr:serine hydrolase [Candidatus Aminicenantes bacterium]